MEEKSCVSGIAWLLAILGGNSLAIVHSGIKIKLLHTSTAHHGCFVDVRSLVESGAKWAMEEAVYGG